MNSQIKSELKSWGKSVIIAVGIVAVVRTFFFSPYEVEGASMEPTLHNEEKVFVNKLSDLKRGEIVIIKGEDENYVKRLIGLPGDIIEMKNDQLFINGILFEEPYLSENRKLAKQVSNLLTGDFGPIKVPEDQYFVMGDNRLKSMDSRNGLGFIPKEEIIGQSEFVYFPFSQIRKTD